LPTFFLHPFSKIITDNVAFARTVLVAGLRPNYAKTSLADVLPEEIEAEVKEAAEISMGTEVCFYLI
jgi:nucleolar protein 58